MGQLGRTQKSQAASEKKLKAYACELEKKLEARTRELAEARGHLSEALEQQTATSEVLRVISSSPGELQPVFQAMLENATRLCEAKFGTLYLCEGDALRTIAMYGAPAAFAEARRRNPMIRPNPETTFGRALATKRAVQIGDVQDEPGYANAPPGTTGAQLAKLAGARTVLVVPMVKENELVGAIVIYRQEVRPFTDKQIELVQNFAAQAVIAIENTRLLNELRQRTDDLSEALEQQTATSEVLQVISSSPGALEPVFETMLANATRFCEAKFGFLNLYDGDKFRIVALYNVPSAYAETRRDQTFRPHPRDAHAEVLRTKEVVHVEDARSLPPYLEGDPRLVVFADLGGARTFLITPMIKENELIGTIGIYRQEVRPFTDKQIKLVKNFAAQAVIAIENTRLLNELRQRTDDLTEALEQQTATSEVLSIISRSPGELEPVFQAMLSSATRICEAKFGNLLLYEGGQFRVAAMQGASPAWAEKRSLEPEFRPGSNNRLALVAKTKQVQHVADLTADQSYIERDPATVAIADIAGARTILLVPMLKEQALVGTIGIYRTEVRPFTDKQIELVQNFAAQAVIAIEN